MLRMIAYGTELNLAHPPRPTNPKLAWEPEWSLKVRVKSVATGMLGMPDMSGSDGMDETGADGTGDATAPSGDSPAAEEPPKKKKFGWKDAVDAVKKNVPIP